MKAGWIVIVVLSLAAHSLAQGAGSAGVQCVYQCMNPDSAETSVARSAFQQVVHSASASEDRKCTGGSLRDATCVVICQVDKYSALAQEVSLIWHKYCDYNVAPSTTEKYLAETEQFGNIWLAEWDKCLENTAEPDTPEETCRLASDCIFGSALTISKNGISDDVVSINENFNKIRFAVYMETTYGEPLPNSCDFLFEPNVPEPPYPYEPYPHEPYQQEPCQRSPYQRYSYQRNPYQRNPYRRSPYQRKQYRRKPY